MQTNTSISGDDSLAGAFQACTDQATRAESYPETLCERCREADLEGFLNRNIKPPEAGPKTAYKKSDFRDDCALCVQLVAREHVSDGSMKLYLYGKNSDKKSRPLRLTYGRYQQSIMYLDDVSTSHREQGSVDFDVIKGWLVGCGSSLCRSKTRRGSPGWGSPSGGAGIRIGGRS